MIRQARFAKSIVFYGFRWTFKKKIRYKKPFFHIYGIYYEDFAALFMFDIILQKYLQNHYKGRE